MAFKSISIFSLSKAESQKNSIHYILLFSVLKLSKNSRTIISSPFFHATYLFQKLGQLSYRTCHVLNLFFFLGLPPNLFFYSSYFWYTEVSHRAGLSSVSAFFANFIGDALCLYCVIIEGTQMSACSAFSDAKIRRSF